MTLDSVIAAMYESVCFEEGERPDWQRQDEIFAHGARLVRITDDGVFEFNLQTYREDIDHAIDSGAFPSFWEGEIWREAKQFGEMAHVLSAYETRRSRGGEVLNRGVNSIQLFERDGRWWVSALLWRREGKLFRVPGEASRLTGS